MDFEDPEYTLAQAVKAFCDCRHVIGTTKSHGTDKGGKHGRPIDCFRVAIPWGRTITDVTEYAFNMQRVADTYPLDRAARDPARLFYPCREVVSVSTEGYALDVKPAPAPRAPAYIPPGMVTPWATYWLAHVIPIGRRTPYAYGIARDLARAGFSLETAHARLSTSPTFRGCQNQHSLRKLKEAVISAYKKEAKA